MHTTAQRRSLLWRIHFWAALISSPFALAAALTGMLYALTPQIEAQLYGHLDTVVAQGQPLPLDKLVSTATQAAPHGWVLQSVMPPARPSDSVKVAFVPPAAAAKPAAAEHPTSHMFLPPSFGAPGNACVVYLNPHTGEVLGQMPQGQRFSQWSRKLHSNWLQGKGWRWMIELAASWMMVMLLSGVWLWWPRAGQRALPQVAARGRIAWKQWHAFGGVALSLLSFVILSTGLTWSQYAGDQVRWARDATGQTPPRIPAHVHSDVPAQGQRLSWEAALQAVRRAAPDVPMQIMPPQGPTGVWRANHLDRSGEPTKRFDLLLDAYSGEPLYFSGWAQQTAFGKATAVGIPFHRGELGVWNQALLLVFGLGVVGSIASGWVMYAQRRRKGVAGMPPLLPGAWRSAGWGGDALAIALCVAMPLLAASSAAIVVIECWLWRRAVLVNGPR